MLRINPIKSGGASYYKSENADYYLDHAIPAQWHGHGARMLGLSGEVQFDDFRRIMNNRTPSGDKLTPMDHPSRRQGDDFTFSVPKSVSLLALVARDPRLIDGVRKAVAETMAEAEKHVGVQIRGERGVERTGSMIWADFVHLTTRPLDGYPDPHLHVHAVVANATWTINGWRANDISDIKKHADYYQAFFRQKLAEQLQGMGYELRTSEKDFEIRGVPLSAIQATSRRTSQIDALAARLAEERGYESLSAEGKAKLGATSRERKEGFSSLDDLRQRWIASLPDGDYGRILAVFEDSFRSKLKTTVPSRVMESLEASPSIFTHTKPLLAAAIYSQLGSTPVESHKEAIARAIGAGLMIRATDKTDWLTTKDKLLKEMRLVDMWSKFKNDGRQNITVKPPKMHKDVFNKLVRPKNRLASFRAMMSRTAKEQLDEIANALGDAVFLESPTLDEALTFTEKYPNATIILVDKPRKEGPRQTVSDMAEDLLGIPSITLTERESPSILPRIARRIGETVEQLRRSSYVRQYQQLFERATGGGQERAQREG